MSWWHWSVMITIMLFKVNLMIQTCCCSLMCVPFTFHYFVPGRHCNHPIPQPAIIIRCQCGPNVNPKTLKWTLNWWLEEKKRERERNTIFNIGHWPSIMCAYLSHITSWFVWWIKNMLMTDADVLYHVIVVFKWTNLKTKRFLEHTQWWRLLPLTFDVFVFCSISRRK